MDSESEGAAAGGAGGAGGAGDADGRRAAALRRLVCLGLNEVRLAACDVSD